MKKCKSFFTADFIRIGENSRLINVEGIDDKIMNIFYSFVASIFFRFLIIIFRPEGRMVVFWFSFRYPTSLRWLLNSISLDHGGEQKISIESTKK